MQLPGGAILAGRRGAARAVVVTAVVAAIGCVVAVPGAGAAGGAVVARFPGAAALKAVSCPGPTWCMAVGTYIDPSHKYHSLAQTWAKGAWRVLKAPPGQGLYSISCTSPSFCMAWAMNPSDTSSATERWNGTTWTVMASPPVPGSPSCGDRRLCLELTSTAIETWFGRKWRIFDPQVCDVPGQPCGLTAVSCGDGVNCMAVGFTTIDQAGDGEPRDYTWNGTGWASGTPPGDAEGDPATAGVVACAGRSFCLEGGSGFSEVAGGLVPTAGIWSNGQWTDISSTLETGQCSAGCWPTSNLTCGSPVSCMYFDGASHTWWNGTAWRQEPSVSAGRGSGLTAVGCGGSICMAAGYRTIRGAVRTLAELWNGTTWKILPTPRVT